MQIFQFKLLADVKPMKNDLVVAKNLQCLFFSMVELLPLCMHEVTIDIYLSAEASSLNI